MKKKLVSLSLLLAAAALLLGLVPVLRAQDRYFDTAPAEHDDVRLVVFHPTANRIKDLIALRAEKLIDIPDLTVIGVYHQKEDIDIAASKALVQGRDRDWFKFHEVRTEIPAGDVFKPNALSAEVERIFRLSDGMIFTGGPDVPPEMFGNKTSLLTVIEDPARHVFEIAALFELLGGSQDQGFKPLLASRPDYPILAICLGAQSLNVATGGTLIQDIWNDVYGKSNVEDILPLGLPNWHNNPYVKLYPRSGLAVNTLQPIALLAGGKFVREMGFAPDARPHVLSSHHQAMGKLGKDITVEATSLDGKVVEALAHAKFPNVLATQFHPESMNLWDAALPYRLSPEETDPPSWRGYLEAHPPSLEFHRKLWAWFAARLRGGHQGSRAS
jgi:putative glutamine amidotransferase